MYMHAGESGKRKRIRILWNIRLSWCIVCFYDQLENEKNKKKWWLSYLMSLLECFPREFLTFG